MIVKPQISDLPQIEKILNQWTKPEEVSKYLQRIQNEINGKTDFGMQFWVYTSNTEVIGIGGIADPLPLLKPFCQSESCKEIKILYVDGDHQGQGIGRDILNHLIQEIRKLNIREILVRSALRYKFSAYGFYEKMGFKKVGILEGKNEQESMQIFRKII